jgi:hypothetical protein
MYIPDYIFLTMRRLGGMRSVMGTRRDRILPGGAATDPVSELEREGCGRP